MKKAGGLNDRTMEFFCASEDDFARFRVLLSQNNGNCGLQDSCLFGGDFAKGVAQKIFVIEIDGGDDGNDRLKNVGGIKAAAEADFEDAEFDAFKSQRFERHGRYRIQIGGMRAELSIGQEFFDQIADAS